MNHVLSHKFFLLRTILHYFALPSPMITGQNTGIHVIISAT